MPSEKFNHLVNILCEDYALERSIEEQVCADKEGNPLPWYTYPAIEYLNQFDYTSKKIFEFGTGSSSKFWAARAEQVVSVEDNPTWYAKWQQELTAPNQTVLLRNEDSSYENAVFEPGCRFDVIVVDGKRRAECCATAMQNLAPGGLIILDDSDRINTSREYVESVNILRQANLLQVDFYGFCPMNCYTKTTSLFFSRDFNFASRHPVQPINGIGNLWGMGRRNRKEFIKKIG